MFKNHKNLLSNNPKLSEKELSLNPKYNFEKRITFNSNTKILLG